MRYYLLAVGLIGAVTVGANAGTQLTWNFHGDVALTDFNLYGQEGTPGWRLSWANEPPEPYGDQGEDATWGTGGALKLLDDDDRGWRSSHLNYYAGESLGGETPTLGKQGGIAIARVKVNDVNGAGVGFGYSTADGNHCGILGLQNGSVSITGWRSGNVYEYDTNGAEAGKQTSTGNNVGMYRTYALAWSVDFSESSFVQYDVWVSNANYLDLNNAANWTQVITNLHPRDPATDGAMPGAPLPNPWPYGDLGVESGVMLGSFGPGTRPGLEGYGRTSSGDMDFDWLITKYNDQGYGVFMTPWGSGIEYVPEPGSLALMVLAGFGLLRRRCA